MNTTNVIISYVVPVYNSKKYIKKCIESILNNCTEECELLLVDDGSTDGTAKICDGYANNKVRVLHKTNGGASSARNEGIRQALGKWICFIDADDTIIEGLTDAVRYYLTDEYDIVFFDSIKDSNKFYEIDVETADLFQKYTIYPSPQVEKSKNFVNVRMVTCWGKFYRKKFLTDNNIYLFEDIILAEDILFNLIVYSYSPRMGYFDKKFYNHIIHYDSLCHGLRADYKIVSDKIIEKLYYIMKKYYNNDPSLCMLIYGNIINLIENNCVLDFCNLLNTETKKEKKRKFDQLITDARYQVAIMNCDYSILIDDHCRLLRLLRKKDFDNIYLLYSYLHVKRRVINILEKKNLHYLVNVFVKLKRKIFIKR